MTTSLPRLLLVEDDPTSLHFLRTALRALPAAVDTAATLAQARLLAAQRRYDVWLIDAHLPDGRGEGLLAHLRSCGGIAAAIAHTAACDGALAAHLLACGFDAVIHKPLAAARLREVVEAQLRRTAWPAAPVPADAGLRIAESACDDDTQDPAPTADAPAWDNAAAARALKGSSEHVAALRALFLAELPGERDAVMRAARAGEAPVLEALLHRLRASCGFVGATALGHAVRALHARPSDGAALQTFELAVEACLASAAGLAGVDA